MTESEQPGSSYQGDAYLKTIESTVPDFNSTGGGHSIFDVAVICEFKLDIKSRLTVRRLINLINSGNIHTVPESQATGQRCSSLHEQRPMPESLVWGAWKHVLCSPLANTTHRSRLKTNGCPFGTSPGLTASYHTNSTSQRSVSE